MLTVLTEATLQTGLIRPLPERGGQVIHKAERDEDAAILAAATGGTWITAIPRSQEGGVCLADFGGLDAPEVPTALRVAGKWSLAQREVLLYCS